jgi:hypothetical protein
VNLLIIYHGSSQNEEFSFITKSEYNHVKLALLSETRTESYLPFPVPGLWETPSPSGNADIDHTENVVWPIESY